MRKPAPPAAMLYDVRRIEVVNARTTGEDARATVVAVARDWLWFEAARLPVDRVLIGLGSPSEAGDAQVVELIGIRADGQIESYTRCRPTVTGQLDAFFETRRQTGDTRTRAELVEAFVAGDQALRATWADVIAAPT